MRMNIAGSKFYVRTKSAMKALFIKSLNKRFELPLMNLERFVEQWAKLQESLQSETTISLVILNQKFRQIKLQGNIEK